MVRAFLRFAAGLHRQPEAVWELGEHRYFYIDERPERAGRAIHTVFVDDFDARSAAMAERGVQPTARETYANGVRKLIYRDPEGNEIGLGGAPAHSLD